MNLHEVNFELTYPVPISTIWKAWTDPETMLKWIGADPKGKGLKASIDLKVGGEYEFTFQDSDGEVHTNFGTYLEILAMTHLKYDFHWESEPGQTSYVSVDLSEAEGGTIMFFTHSSLSPESAHDYQHGWESTFEKLAALVAP